jgi:hypothetical protein
MECLPRNDDHLHAAEFNNQIRTCFDLISYPDTDTGWSLLFCARQVGGAAKNAGLLKIRRNGVNGFRTVGVDIRQANLPAVTPVPGQIDPVARRCRV